MLRRIHRGHTQVLEPQHNVVNTTTSSCTVGRGNTTTTTAFHIMGSRVESHTVLARGRGRIRTPQHRSNGRHGVPAGCGRNTENRSSVKVCRYIRRGRKEVYQFLCQVSGFFRFEDSRFSGRVDMYAISFSARHQGQAT